MKTAVLLIDLQPEWYSEIYISNIFPRLPETITSLLRICRNAKLEVVHIRAVYSKQNIETNGQNWSNWMDRFRELNPDKQVEIDGTTKVEAFATENFGEKVILKPTFDAFSGTDLHKYLQERQIERLLVAGLLTSVCVQATAMSAFLRGYRVELIQDCCGDRSLERHEAAIMLYGNYIYKIRDTDDLKKEFKHQ